MLPPDAPVTELKNVGPKRAALYQKLGIETVSDLLTFYPRSYQDFTSPKMAAECRDGEPAVIEGKILRKLPPAYIRRGMVLYKLTVTDGMQNFTVTIFNNEYAYYGVHVGETYIFAGKWNRLGNAGSLAMQTYLSPGEAATLRPVYPLTEGLSSKMVQTNVQDAIARALPGLPDPIPDAVRAEYGLIGFRQAVQEIHFPESQEQMETARDRLAFEELLRLTLALKFLKGRGREKTRVRVQRPDLKPFVKSLPFPLTGAQKRVIAEILRDMASPYPMNRLLQGDVGSGKTLVAAAVSYAAIQKGYQAALMAPTEILAAQHEKTLRKFLEPMGVKVGLLTGSLSPKQKTAMREAIERGEIQMVAGTHALVQEATAFHRLGLVITDEQHRFGVHQRQMLGEKGDHPHVLVMSATPIPRTLALIVYGDLDISVIDELPAGRQPIETFSVHSDKRERALTYIRAHLDRGEQGYIVCPLIDKSDAVSAAAATAYRDELAEGIFKGYTVGLLHGRMKPDEKEAVMADFAAGKVQLLVATTVVEVGVDVPNATIILIENAERFGLSQLHQLRGRVGRGDKKSTCILLSDNDGEDNKRRLKVMKETCDGFVIAKEDLKLRGAGDFFGYRQHGMPSLGLADLLEDTALFAKAQAAAAEILQADPGLQKPEHAVLKRQIDEMAAESGKN
ncbi:MAG TPA: ATP-dependent DNA helicase RecG [Candidatus Faecivivens stercoravium]|uniref:ATP-dependent DNA helicase RecG n=1 Tax=Candidatus Faecivivens stercoravium TaxID=2840803 RepID=A0A9D1J4P5_9FIRM|nr:ATP-dependent DNA helicase RecG [Candidatus Faecivivens stercoravium]